MKLFEVTWVCKPRVMYSVADNHYPELDEAPQFVEAKDIEQAVKKLKKLNFKDIEVEHLKSYYRSVKVLK